MQEALAALQPPAGKARTSGSFVGRLAERLKGGEQLAFIQPTAGKGEMLLGQTLKLWSDWIVDELEPPQKCSAEVAYVLKALQEAIEQLKSKSGGRA